MTGHTHRAVKRTAVAAVAMAAMTASQAPGALASAPAKPVRAAPGPSVSGDSLYRTELPPLRTRDAAVSEADPGSGGSAVTAGGVLPATVLAAYRRAEAELARSTPDCRLRWQLLAAIGQVESGQARGGRLTADGTTLSPILGPRLDGDGFATITDTDGGVHDGDTVYDRAVGPMQFIPSTWAVWGADGNGDGHSDPGNIHDAALAAARYLCAGGRDLSDPADLDRAILGYNHSMAYLRTVLAWFAHFLGGHRVVPDLGSGPADGPEPGTPDTPRTPRPSKRSEPSAPAGGLDGGSPPPAPAPAPTTSASPSPSKSGDGGVVPGAPRLPVPGPVAGPSGVPVVGTLTVPAR
ncbi:lytic transglycosylase domain-containing protein [Streptomyces sp. NPDC057445]|uniref:lytic transglycosylase domain-containing protein n=1 Tax=Streptomyces sp. NPDC057445 TaxID=3346136 RepID=UPI003699DEB9